MIGAGARKDLSVWIKPVEKPPKNLQLQKEEQQIRERESKIVWTRELYYEIIGDYLYEEVSAGDIARKMGTTRDNIHAHFAIYRRMAGKKEKVKCGRRSVKKDIIEMANAMESANVPRHVTNHTKRMNWSEDADRELIRLRKTHQLKVVAKHMGRSLDSTQTRWKFLFTFYKGIKNR